MSNKNQPPSKVSVAFRAQQQLKERIDEYADDNNMSQSDALRRLVREGLEAEQLREELESVEQRVERLEAEQEQSGFWPW